MERLTPEVRDLLTAARDLLERSGWCRGCPATDENGRSVALWSDRAVSFCAKGAVQRVAAEGILPGGTFEQAMRHLGDAALIRQPYGLPPGFYVTAYNDSIAQSKEEMLALFDAALETTP